MKFLFLSLLAVSCFATKYPPHGYPCLGCAPCPGNPTEFCDTIGRSSFTQRQNTTDLNREGYQVQNGRIVPIHRDPRVPRDPASRE